MPQRLEISDKAVELMVFVSMHRDDATEERIVAALWPRKSLARGVQLLQETVAEINHAAALATGDLTPAIVAPGQVPEPVLPGRTPRVLVRVLCPIPFVEVYAADELLPGENLWSSK